METAVSLWKLIVTNPSSLIQKTKIYMLIALGTSYFKLSVHITFKEMDSLEAKCDRIVQPQEVSHRVTVGEHISFVTVRTGPKCLVKPSLLSFVRNRRYVSTCSERDQGLIAQEEGLRCWYVHTYPIIQWPILSCDQSTTLQIDLLRVVICLNVSSIYECENCWWFVRFKMWTFPCVLYA